MQLPQHVRFVIDGGSLLHRLAWRKCMTDDQLVQMYVDFVTRRYGKQQLSWPNTTIGGSCHKYEFCRDKHILVAKKNACFVATKVCLSRQNLPRQNYVCSDKIFLSNFCRDKHVFVCRNRRHVLSRHVSRDKSKLVATNICRDKSFCDKNVCRNKHTFVGTSRQ